MSTKVKVEITQPHPPYEVRVTAQELTENGWVNAGNPDILGHYVGQNVEGLVYGTRRLIIEEVM